MSKIIDNYILQNSIGSGQYGKVYKAFHTITNEVVAVKVIKLERFKQVPKLNDFTINEINTLQRVKNKNVIEFIEMLRTVNNIYLVYQFCNGGNLEETIHSKGFLPENQALNYFGQLLNAFETLTKEKILHRDLKPSNILLHNGQIVVADFGFCKTLEGPMDLTQTMVGSPIYMAPEVLCGEPYSLSADVWSLGVTLFEMLFGRCPFEENTIPRLMFQIQNKQLDIPYHIQRISEGTEWLLRRMLNIDPVRRIQWAQLFDIYNKGKETLSKETKPQLSQSSPNLEIKNAQSNRQNIHSPNNMIKTNSASPNISIKLNTPNRNQNKTPEKVSVGTSRNNYASTQGVTQPPVQVQNRGLSPIKYQFGSRNQQSQNIVSIIPSQPRPLTPVRLNSNAYIGNPYLHQKTVENKPSTYGSNLTQDMPKNPESQKYSSESTETIKNHVNTDYSLQVSLKLVLNKRAQLLQQLQVLDHILEMNDNSQVPSLSYLLIKHVAIQLQEFLDELNNQSYSERQEISWNEFRGTKQFLKCQLIIQADLVRVNGTVESFKKELRRIQIQEFSFDNPATLRRQLLREGINYLENISFKLERIYDPLVQRRILHHEKELLTLLIEIGKWNYLLNDSDRIDQQKVVTLLQQIKILLQSSY